MKNIASSYFAATAAILVNLQPLLGLSFTSAEWTAAITVVCGLVVAVRQVLNKRSNWLGARV